MPNTLTREFFKTSIYQPGIFNGKVAFITGGAGSICRVQAETLVLLGADVAIIGRNAAKAEAAAKEVATLRDGAKVIGIGNVDVSDVKTLVPAVEKTVAELGKIDIVIAGAAGNFLSPVSALSTNAFRRVIEIDLIGSYNTFKATFDQLRENKGHILFVSATLQYRGLPLQAHASAAKAGVDTLMKVLAVELGPLGIQSNAIAPGPIGDTEVMVRLAGKTKTVEDGTLPIPLGRMGTTKEIADGTAYLLSDVARYVTGQILVVDGGQWHVSGIGGVKYPQDIITANSGKNKL